MDLSNDDVRVQTYQNRLEIGFLPEYTDWMQQPATFTDHELVINGHPVMEDWEDPYMRDLAEISTQNGGRVLEVGFGMGISARYIQEFPIEEHLIIEANKDVFAKLEDYAKSAKVKTTPLFGFWQEAILTIPDNSIDGILFDTYPLTQAEIHQNHFDFFEQAYRILKTGGVLTYYSDEVSDYSPQHLARLQDAGFKNIDKKITKVAPPSGCQYWVSQTIMSPVVTK